MCVGFQFANESLFYYQSVCAVQKVAFQYNTFKVRDWMVRLLKCLATGSPLSLSQITSLWLFMRSNYRNLDWYFVTIANNLVRLTTKYPLMFLWNQLLPLRFEPRTLRRPHGCLNQLSYEIPWYTLPVGSRRMSSLKTSMSHNLHRIQTYIIKIV